MTRRKSNMGRTGEHALTPGEVEALLAGVTRLEDEALLRLAISTGIRREDIVAVPLANVDLTTGTVQYWEAKKKRVWTVQVGGQTLKVLAQHVGKLPRGAKWLFPSPLDGGRHMAGMTAWRLLQRWLRKAGLRERPFHALRATCIKMAQKKGWGPAQVSRLTGDTIRTIQEHYETPSPGEMVELAKANPIL